MIYTHRISRAKKRGVLGFILGLFMGIIITLTVDTKFPLIPFPQTEASSEHNSKDDNRQQPVANNTPDWQLMLINEEHPIGSDYAPPALTQIDSEHFVDSRIAQPLQAMMADGKAQGLQMYITSAYRPYDAQRELFNSGMESRMSNGLLPLEAYQNTKASVALPGASEHQAGLAVDIIASYYPELDEHQGDTPEQQWLMAHCQEYGFILRYPKDATEITGITYEPWHYRYVGKKAAQKISSQKITLEEYLASSVP